MMNRATIDSKIMEFNNRIKELFNQIEEWVTPYDWKVKVEAITNIEQLSGKYETYQLLINSEIDEKVARITPVGIWIIGGEGRVDLIGSAGAETIVYFSEGGPSMNTSISVGDKVQETYNKSLYGYKTEGWHWIDYRVMGRKPKLDREIFLNLLEVVN